MRLKSLFVLLALVPGVACAKPTYLSCTFMVDGVPEVFKVTADPENSSVSTLVVRSGGGKAWRAVFTPDQVVFGDDDVGFVLSRVTLRLAKTVNLINSTTYGQCKKSQAPTKVAF